VSQFCTTDDSGSYEHTVYWVDRHSAAFCIDQGGYHQDFLYYQVCGTSSVPYIWAENQWFSPTFLAWNWIAPSEVRRAWTHNGVNIGGHPHKRDFAHRWGTTYAGCGG